MAKEQFKAESRKLLDLMINSIYTHKEIFIRELISNASDALDKLYYKTLESGDTGIQRKDFNILIATDKEERTLTISDNGIGMTAAELEANLGTIAKSGSEAFKSAEADGEQAKKIDIIGQFGVGFYSAFMVADKVTVTSRAYGQEEANRWISEGASGYIVEPAVRDEAGTTIVLHLKEDAGEEKYSTYLDEYTIRRLIKKYSDYIRYPIRMEVTKQRRVEESAKTPHEEAQSANGTQEDENNDSATTAAQENDAKEGSAHGSADSAGGTEAAAEESKAAPAKEPVYESYTELETLNSMEPIWKRQKSRVKPEEYNEYYKSKFYDYMDPARVIRTSVEGVSSFTALLFIPSHEAFDYYTKDFEKGLALYSSGVLIMEKCADLLPDYFNFVRGLVDSMDLSLNISRETLQHDRQLRSIARNVEKKIKRDLEDFLKNDREGYEKFFTNFGKQLKYGLYEDYGAHRDVLEDLVLFYSSAEKKLVTLAEYVSRMKEDQKEIYYAAGESNERIAQLPQTAYLTGRGYEVLYLSDEIDEFVLKVLGQYKEKKFVSVLDDAVSRGQSEEEKQRIAALQEENKELLESIKKALDGKVAEVRLAPHLADTASGISAKGEVSLEMEKVLNAMPMGQGMKADRVLELNPDAPVFKKMQEAQSKGDEGKEKIQRFARLLYDQALLIAGLPVEDPVAFSRQIAELMAK